LGGANRVAVMVGVVFCENGLSVVEVLYVIVIGGFLADVKASVTGFKAPPVLNDIAIGL